MVVLDWGCMGSLFLLWEALLERYAAGNGSTSPTVALIGHPNG